MRRRWHPPGALLVFVGLDRLGLSGGGPAAVLCVLVGASVAVAVAVTLRALGAAVGGGLLLGGSLYLSYGLAAAGLLPLAVAVAARRVAPLLVAGAGVAAVATVFTVAGFWWLEGYQQIRVRYYQPGEYGLERPYGYWVWANLAAPAIALGPAVVAGLRRMFAYHFELPADVKHRLCENGISAARNAAYASQLVTHVARQHVPP